ncbi:hypothetical protein OIU84_002326 [Salix udensis]|uniref:Gnk2-homologous domain-containing protein n=1 Tax=Salix udensis TaxID=889485 RepID=A0AAD6P583_9ROSI|nr:hypothetical protein OIU84_002326 [Salix udensis]
MTPETSAPTVPTPTTETSSSLLWPPMSQQMVVSTIPPQAKYNDTVYALVLCISDPSAEDCASCVNFCNSRTQSSMS